MIAHLQTVLWIPLRQWQISSMLGLSQLPPTEFVILTNPPQDKSNPVVTTFKSLKCWYTNADSFSNKLDELKTRISVSKPDIVALTDINPKFGKPKAYKGIIPFTITHKRGVCIFVDSNLHTYKDDVLSSVTYSESIWCRIPLSGNNCLLFIIPGPQQRLIKL